MVLVANGLNGIAPGEDLPFRTVVSPRSRLGASCVVSTFPMSYREGVIFMAVGRGGYVGLTRVGDGHLNVACAFDPPLIRARGTPAAAASWVLAEAGFPEVPSLSGASWLGTLPLSRRTGPVAAERVFLIGDATGYVEPFTGEGMSWALSAAGGRRPPGSGGPPGLDPRPGGGLVTRVRSPHRPPPADLPGPRRS